MSAAIVHVYLYSCYIVQGCSKIIIVKIKEQGLPKLYGTPPGMWWVYSNSVKCNEEEEREERDTERVSTCVIMCIIS